MSEMNEATSGYIRELSNYPLLTADREKELAQIIQGSKTGKRRDKAIDEIVKHNLKLVVKEAFRYSKKSKLEIDDFIGAGNEGLMRAAEKFNPQKFKTKFSTYATYWIREAMQDYVYKCSSIITIPVHISNGVARHKKIISGENGKTVSDKTFMKELGVNESALGRIVGVNKIKVVSMNQELSGHSMSNSLGDCTTFGDTLIDNETPSPSENSANIDDYSLLYNELNKLDPETREIVISQCMNDKVQLKKLGKKFNLTGERVRQIKSSALKKLRKKLEKKLSVRGKRLKG
jgi:RNA polymerase sigma factor (sigma-70 family)